MIRHTKISHMIPLEASAPLYPTRKGKFVISDLFINGFCSNSKYKLCNDKTYKNLTYDPIGGFSSTLPNPKKENLDIFTFFIQSSSNWKLKPLNRKA